MATVRVFPNYHAYLMFVGNHPPFSHVAPLLQEVILTTVFGGALANVALSAKVIAARKKFKISYVRPRILCLSVVQPYFLF